MNTERQTRLAQALAQILEILTTQYQPEKVILFGSMASGTVHEWSDLDLVIVKDTSKPFLQRLKEVALMCQASVGLDFLVYTPNEFAQMISEQNPFVLEEIVRRGKVVYERQPAQTVA
jgi:predicted nucleotidyltransferase